MQQKYSFITHKIIGSLLSPNSVSVWFQKYSFYSFFLHFKDRVSCGLQSCLVYKFSCVQCSSTYIGETSRHLLARIADHKGISIRTGQPFTTPSYSSIRDHALKAGHDINIDNFKICHMTDKTSLKISESILIRKFNPDLNNKDSSIKLNILSWILISRFFGLI